MPRPPGSFVFCRFTGGRCDEATPGWLRSPPGWSKAVGARGTEEAEEGQGVLRGCTGVHGGSRVRVRGRACTGTSVSIK